MVHNVTNKISDTVFPSPELSKFAVWLGNPLVGVHHVLLHIEVAILVILEKFRILNENKNFTLK